MNDWIYSCHIGDNIVFTVVMKLLLWPGFAWFDTWWRMDTIPLTLSIRTVRRAEQGSYPCAIYYRKHSGRWGTSWTVTSGLGNTLSSSPLWTMTLWGLVTHMSVNELGRHWLRLKLVACSTPTHYLNQRLLPSILFTAKRLLNTTKIKKIQDIASRWIWKLRVYGVWRRCYTHTWTHLDI